MVIIVAQSVDNCPKSLADRSNKKSNDNQSKSKFFIDLGIDPVLLVSVREEFDLIFT